MQKQNNNNNNNIKNFTPFGADNSFKGVEHLFGKVLMLFPVIFFNFIFQKRNTDVQIDWFGGWVGGFWFVKCIFS